MAVIPVSATVPPVNAAEAPVTLINTADPAGALITMLPALVNALPSTKNTFRPGTSPVRVTVLPLILVVPVLVTPLSFAARSW